MYLRDYVYSGPDQSEKKPIVHRKYERQHGCAQSRVEYLLNEGQVVVSHVTFIKRNNKTALENPQGLNDRHKQPHTIIARPNVVRPYHGDQLQGGTLLPEPLH